ncbi:MFS transporter [Azospirillum picis]|uniref:MFS family arabinose efflux permease n=1 Tax=Azospirillum picis TaxID=488438 RepID=A0ABU0MJH7_9PROT|nr:MFS transporter [Azospirillum picis]MBP2299824.1 putative MFS family arabinose efflux permease [Azospirillum picis]MDQ0533620.1 putative MFS family arabinose efflux permease [Azospirillum picis]
MASTATTSASDEADRLPMAALLALAMTGFICIVTETLPAGLLPQIGHDLGVSSSLAGQAVTAYALGSLIAAIPLTIATSGWRRRNVLLLTIAGFLVFNSATALSTSYWLTMTARFFAGVAAGLAWSLLAGYARRMVAPHQQGRAMAIAMAGTPVALSLGVPLGTWLGTQVGWRPAFGIMSLLTLLLIAWVLAKVPDYPGQAKGERIPLPHVFRTPGVRPVLGVVIAWMLAHNILYTYIAPFAAVAGLSAHVDLVLLDFGVAALAGIWIAGKFVDRFLRRTVLLSLLAFDLASLAFAFWTASPSVIVAGVAIWGMTFGGAATLLQTALADAAQDGADVALSMNVVAWNGAIAGGGLLGGLLLDWRGAEAFPWALVVLATAGVLIARSARTRGFPAGHRHSTARLGGH